MSRERVYSGIAAAQLTGITYRQLDYWARTDLVRPSVMDAQGSGTRRRYSYDDLLRLNMIRAMLDAGVRLEAVRRVADELARAAEDAYLVVLGDDVVATDAAGLASTVDSQFVVTVLVLAKLRDDLAATVADNEELATLQAV